MCIEVDIDALYENQKPYYAQQAAEAVKAYEILKGMGYSSSDTGTTASGK